MSCNHKFSNDLQLEYVDWEPLTLFIGTFNPGWKECKNNYALWFYGRTQRNNFWCILPTLYGQQPLLNGNRETWINFCRLNKIAITDLIYSIDADVNNQNHREKICKFRDDSLTNFKITTNDIPAILKKYPTIKQVFITRQTISKSLKLCLTDTLNYLQQDQNRQINLIYLRSPSRGAIKGVVGNFCHFVSEKWIEQGFQAIT